MDSKPSSEKKPANSSPSLLLAISGITVSPALTRIDLATDPPVVKLNYINSTHQPLQLTFTAKDFTSLEEGWRVKFISAADAKNYHYSLSSWLEVSPPTLLLAPGATAPVQIAIRSQSLSAGAHYASLIADITAAPPQPRAVSVKSQLVSLIFVRAHTGFEREAARISSFSAASGSWLSLPDKFVLRFDNSGNTELIPHGTISIKDWLGREVARGFVNQDSLITLPETVRRYDIPITTQITSWRLPGPYQASLAVSYGHSQSLSSHLEFFSLADRIYLYLGILILLASLLLARYLLQKVKRRQQSRP